MLLQVRCLPSAALLTGPGYQQGSASLLQHALPQRTYTDNISPHGARVRSTYAWKLGDRAEITPLSGEPPVCGEVVYCQKLDERFFVGLKVWESRILWSILQRFDGIDTVKFDDIEKCTFCGLDTQQKFTAEIAIHLPHFDKPHVFVFPEALVCQHCGKADFTLPKEGLRLL